jgi:hypothetical protein
VGGMGRDAAYAPRPDWLDLRRREEPGALVRVRVLSPYASAPAPLNSTQRDHTEALCDETSMPTARSTRLDLRRREEPGALVRVRVLVRVRAQSPGLERRTG